MEVMEFDDEKDVAMSKRAPGVDHSVVTEEMSQYFSFREDLSRKLTYSVFKYSSYSSSYYPEHVLENKPKDQTSRWSSESITPPQFLILKLQRVSIVQSITFGKYEKNHVCNLKKFKVYGGLTENHMIELLESGLKNDNSPETFILKHEIDGHPFPCRFIRIIPLQSWGPSFNFSIWYVELQGVEEFETVQPFMDRFNAFREKEAIRVCLKHLRDHNHMEAFESLQKRTKIQLEHPFLTDLYETLVLTGDYSKAEEFLERSAKNGLFQEYIGGQDYQTIWVPLGPEFPEVTVSDAPSNLRPGMRGGHQMCIDPLTQTIYLFGGWDGNQDLADFWSYSILKAKWTLISSNTESEGGPSPRSCHKLCLDPVRRHIYTLGRYLDGQCRPAARNMLKSDFFVFDIQKGKWSIVSEDTSANGGPELIFDHQMCMDVEKQTIYVFGGRILTEKSTLIESLQINLNAQAQMIAAMGMVINRNEDRNYFPVNRNNENPELVEGAVNLMAHVREVAEGMQVFDHNNIEPPPIQRRGFPGGDGPPPGRRFIQIPVDLEMLHAAAPALPPVPVAAGSANSPSSANSELLYSGLYSYYIPTNTWTLLRCDVATPKPVRQAMRSRVGHSMLFHPGLRKLFVYAGQRSKEYLNDFFSYDVDTDEIEMISDGQKKSCINSPAAGFTQRATIDPDMNEIYVFSGLSKDKDKREENVQNSFWVFDILRKTWSCVYRNDTGGESFSDPAAEPCPRFAHQLVYDSVSKLHYLFGGNPGRPKDPKLRLDDFWRLRLIRPSVDELLKQCKRLLRKQMFIELAATDSLKALGYLRTSVNELVDHNDEEQTNEFHRLTHLFFPNEEESNKLPSEDETLPLSKEDEQIFKRSQLFDSLIFFFPDSMTQPKINLVDLLPLSEK